MSEGSSFPPLVFPATFSGAGKMQNKNLTERADVFLTIDQIELLRKSHSD